jgi:hypothetical protein
MSRSGRARRRANGAGPSPRRASAGGGDLAGRGGERAGATRAPRRAKGTPADRSVDGTPADRSADGTTVDRSAKGRTAHRTDDRPRAPWHPIPLAEICVFVGLVLMVVGLISGLGNDRGRLLLVTGMALGSLGGLDTAAREHFNGYASHHGVLAGVPAIAAAAILYFARAPWIAVVGAAAVVFAAAFVGLHRAWRRSTE